MDEQLKQKLNTPGSFNNDLPNNNPLFTQVTVAAGGEPVPIIEQKITIRPPYRLPIDIPDWRAGMRSAEAIVPRYVRLFDLYTEMWLDAHLSSVAGKRIMGVTNVKWSFVGADDKPVDSVNEIIKSPGFKKVLSCFVRAKLEHYRMVECSYENGKFGAYIIPPKHMRPRTGFVAYEQTGDDGFNIREGIYANTVLEIGDPYDLGLFLSAAQYVIYKRGGFGDWANFVEVFGQPLVDYEWDGFDEKARQYAEDSLATLGNGGVFSHPAGSKITLLENKANPNGGIQDTFIKALNSEISKVILGQTETTESHSGSGYAQSATHADVEDDINQSDLEDAKAILNGRFIEILSALGVPGVKGGQFIIEGEGEETLSKKDQLEMLIAMVTDLKLPVDDDYIYQTYNIEKPKDYEKLKKALTDATNAQMTDLNADPLKPQTASTPPASGGKKDKKPTSPDGEKGKKPGKLARLMLKYNHFFG